MLLFGFSYRLCLRVLASGDSLLLCFLRSTVDFVSFPVSGQDQFQVLDVEISAHRAQTLWKIDLAFWVLMDRFDPHRPTFCNSPSLRLIPLTLLLGRNVRNVLLHVGFIRVITAIQSVPYLPILSHKIVCNFVGSISRQFPTRSGAVHPM